jgi:hypothetical protein
VFWSWDERWVGRVVTVQSVDFRFEIWDFRLSLQMNLGTGTRI